MSILHDWALRHRIAPEVLHDLQLTLGLMSAPIPTGVSGEHSEAWVQSQVRLDAARKGVTLFRNNVGALKDATGRVVRYGLANDSAALNARIKSSDLIGWRPVLITSAHLGTRIAQFTAREVKEPGWQYTGTERETAQAAFIAAVNSAGGDAAFASGEGTL